MKAEVDALLEADRTLQASHRHTLIDLTCDELTRQILAYVAAFRIAPVKVSVPLRRAA